MRNLTLAAIIAALAFLLFAGESFASVGFQRLTIPDPQGPPIEIGIWSPASLPAKPEPVDLFLEPLARDAPVTGDHLPLVVMSHGNGGAFSSHVDTAMALAEAGFVVAALTHTADNWRDQSGARRVWERSRQLKVLTDYMLNDWAGRGHVDPARIGAFGFSSGGFTVLVSAGGEPDLALVRGHCQEHPDFYDCRIAARTGPSTPAPAPIWTHDPRLKAIVVAAPALGFTFSAQALSTVRQPLQLWRAAADRVLPDPFYAEAVRASLPSPPEFHLVPGADHFDFLPPCPPALQQASPVICSSAVGFDRAAFHARFNAEVVAFFKKTLGSATRP